MDEKDPNVILGSYPCTKYSAIADIHGTRTGDELFLHFFRHVAIQRPDIYIVENVPGMLKFPIVMEAMTKLPDYYVNVFCPVNSNIWLPQDRKRLIIVGSRRSFNWTPPELTSNNRTSLKDLIEKDPDIDYSTFLNKACYKRINGEYRDRPIISDPELDHIAPTCVAHYAKDRSTRMVKDSNSPIGARPYTVKEYARLMGVPDSFKFAGSDNDSYRQIGNGVPAPIGRWLAKEIKRYYAPYLQTNLF